MIGRHATTKKPTDPTFDTQWSGVSYAPHCIRGCACSRCGEPLHAESHEHYCPCCDDFVRPAGPPHEAESGEDDEEELEAE